MYWLVQTFIPALSLSRLSFFYCGCLAAAAVYGGSSDWRDEAESGSGDDWEAVQLPGERLPGVLPRHPAPEKWGQTAAESLCKCCQPAEGKVITLIQAYNHRWRKNSTKVNTSYNCNTPLRENVLQETSAKHKEFQNTCQSLNSFLDNLPANEINPNDDLSQVAAKQNSQKVR